MCWKDFLHLGEWGFLQVILLAATLWVAYRQLRKHTRTEKITALAKLRELLTSEKNMRVHRFLLPIETQREMFRENLVELEKQKKEVLWVDVFNYLGTLELGVIMKKEGIIDKDCFCSQFGYRIQNVFNNDTDFHRAVQNHINDDLDSYNILNEGREMMREL